MIKLFNLNKKIFFVILIISLCVLLMYKISCMSKEENIEQFKSKLSKPGCYIFTRNCKNNYWKNFTNGKWFNDEIHGANPIKSNESCKIKRNDVKELCKGGSYVRHKYIARKDEINKKKEKEPGCYIFTRKCQNQYWKNRTNGKMDKVEISINNEPVKDIYSPQICSIIKQNIKSLCKGGTYVKSKFITSKEFIEKYNKTNQIWWYDLIKTIKIYPVLNESITLDKLFDPNYSDKLVYNNLITIEYYDYYIYNVNEMVRYSDNSGLVLREIISIDSLVIKVNNFYSKFKNLKGLDITNIKLKYFKEMNLEKNNKLGNLILRNIEIGKYISDIKFNPSLDKLQLDNTGIGKYINNLHLPNNLSGLFINNENIANNINELKIHSPLKPLKPQLGGSYGTSVYIILTNTDVTKDTPVPSNFKFVKQSFWYTRIIYKAD